MSSMLQRKPVGIVAGRRLFSDTAWTQLAHSLRLSAREFQIVQGVFDDKKEVSIARDLGISPHTVHTHLERLYDKLEVASRVALVLRVVAEHQTLPTGHLDESPSHQATRAESAQASNP